MDTLALLLVAAGLSSRMGDFKPLLDLGKKPLIERTLDIYREAGIKKTVIVTGYRACELEAQLKDRDIIFIRNERYAETEMFDSVKLGLQALQKKCGLFFFSPADIPAVRPQSIRAILNGMKAAKAAVIQPTYQGEYGHPLLIDASCIPALLQNTGVKGLRGAIESSGFNFRTLELPDPGLLMDADTPEGYAAIKTYFEHEVSDNHCFLKEAICQKVQKNKKD